MNPNSKPFKTKPASAERVRPKPDPARFDNFNLLSDETGFTIDNCDHVFYFDKHGGWYDEHENYYNEKGQPCNPPSDRSGDDSYDDYGDNPADKWADEYEEGSDDGDDQIQKYDSIFANAENNKNLALYVPDTEVEIDIENLNYKSNQNDLKQFLEKEGVKTNEIDYEWDKYRNRFTGRAFIQLDYSEAPKLINLNGAVKNQNVTYYQKFWGREIKVKVLPPADVEDVPEDLPVPDLALVKTAESRNEETKKIDVKPKVVEKEAKKEEPKKIENNSVEQKKTELIKPEEPKEREVIQKSESIIKNEPKKEEPVSAQSFAGAPGQWGKNDIKKKGNDNKNKK